MNFYNTGNPVPSNDPRDLDDNAKNLDLALNSDDPSFIDRKGVQRKTISGYGDAFSDFLGSQGWSSLGSYASGVNIISHAQFIEYQGQAYALKSTVPASVSSPYVTTGNWAAESANFKLVGDNSLRQDLISSIGAQQVGSASGKTLQEYLDNGSGIYTKSFDDSFLRKLSDRFSDVVNVVDFFAPGVAFNTAGALNDALDRAQASLTRPATLHIPKGFFTLNRVHFISNTMVTRITGEGMYGTVIGCTVALGGLPMFKGEPASGQTIDSFELLNLGLLGSGFAAFGFQCEHIIHSSFTSVMVQGTSVYGIRTNDGYNVDFNNCHIFSNSGGGIDFSGGNNNNVNVNFCKVYANGGVGVQMGNGWGVTLNGCGIEANAVTGVLAFSLRGLVINGGYFERNGGLGFSFTTSTAPEAMNVKCDIMLLNGGRLISTPEVAGGVIGAVIQGVSFTPYGTGNVPAAGLGQDCIIFTTSLENLRVSNNDIVDPSRVKGLVGMYNNLSRSIGTSAIIEQNTRNDITLVGAGIPDYSIDFAHNIENSTEKLRFNYSPQAVASFPAINGTTGALTVSAAKYGTSLAWQASAGDRLYGLTIDLSVNSELRGKYVWFGLAYRVQEDGTGLRILCGGNASGDGVEGVTASGTWLYKSSLKFIPASATTFTVAFSRLGGGTQPLIVARPTLSVVGTSFSHAIL